MTYSPFGDFGYLMFAVLPAIAAIGFVVILAMMIVRSIQSAKQWKSNNASPVLTVDAKVTAKRTDVSYHTHQAGANDMGGASSFHTSTYYATFEVAGGDRMEFRVRDTEYGMLAENDTGKLTFQGTRYLGFERSRS